MKSKKIFSIFLIILLCVISAGCTGEVDDKVDNKGYKDMTDLYTVTKNDDNTYSYSFSDVNGKILFEKENFGSEPKINQISATVYELITQSGTGLSTNWAVYCDVKNSKASETYYYVLSAKENYVIYADFNNGEHSVIVQNIFDKKQYYKEYKLENVSPVATDFVTDCKFDDDGNAIVTYLASDDYKETELKVQLP